MWECISCQSKQYTQDQVSAMTSDKTWSSCWNIMNRDGKCLIYFRCPDCHLFAFTTDLDVDLVSIHYNPKKGESPKVFPGSLEWRIMNEKKNEKKYRTVIFCLLFCIAIYISVGLFIVDKPKEYHRIGFIRVNDSPTQELKWEKVFPSPIVHYDWYIPDAIWVGNYDELEKKYEWKKWDYSSFVQHYSYYEDVEPIEKYHSVPIEENPTHDVCVGRYRPLDWENGRKCNKYVSE